MAKRPVDIDDDLLERARSIVDDEKVVRHIERLRGSGALDPARVEEARRPRIAR